MHQGISILPVLPCATVSNWRVGSESWVSFHAFVDRRGEMSQEASGQMLAFGV